MKWRFWKVFTLLAAVATIFSAQPTFAANNSVVHWTEVYVGAYGPNGGVNFSRPVKVTSTIQNHEWVSGNGTLNDSLWFDASTEIHSQNLDCGGYVSTRNSTNFSGGSVSLGYSSTYLVPTGTTIQGWNNGGYNYNYGPKSYSASVQNQGSWLPDSQSCFLTTSGTVSDSWTYYSQ